MNAEITIAQNSGPDKLNRPILVTTVTTRGRLTPQSRNAERRNTSIKIHGHTAITILRKLGATLETEVSSDVLNGYINSFVRADLNRDGFHSKEEYIDQGRYLTPQARAGIFRAADGDSDGRVNKFEYVLNRIITDEAKRIIQRMDDNRDGSVEPQEFTKHTAKMFSDDKLAKSVFRELDGNHDGKIRILPPEFLHTWGQWARADAPSAEKRINQRQSELIKILSNTKKDD